MFTSTFWTNHMGAAIARATNHTATVKWGTRHNICSFVEFQKNTKEHVLKKVTVFVHKSMGFKFGLHFHYMDKTFFKISLFMKDHQGNQPYGHCKISQKTQYLLCLAQGFHIDVWGLQGVCKVNLLYLIILFFIMLS